MDTIKDGGPAFPGQEGPYSFTGMTLRDWFAGQALQGLISNPVALNELLLAVKAKVEQGTEYRKAIHEVLAKRSYEQADAMIAQREKEPKP